MSDLVPMLFIKSHKGFMAGNCAGVSECDVEALREAGIAQPAKMVGGKWLIDTDWPHDTFEIELCGWDHDEMDE